MRSTKKIKIAINGFGRIGRYTSRILLDCPDFELVAINDLADPKAIAHLFKYDSIHGKTSADVRLEDEYLVVNAQKILLFGQSNPENLPWNKLDVDLVIECTGRFTTRPLAEKHIIAGAKKVLISAPSMDPSIPMVVLGVNDSILTGKETIISNASCTTNCLAPMIYVLEEKFGIVKGFASTVHF